MSAKQMERDGIRTLRRWSKGKNIGWATVRVPVEMPTCGHVTYSDDAITLGCSKKARYSTPNGVRCFTHALPAALEGNTHE
jgi:hypothetical protein